MQFVVSLIPQQLQKGYTRPPIPLHVMALSAMELQWRVLGSLQNKCAETRNKRKHNVSIICALVLLTCNISQVFIFILRPLDVDKTHLTNHSYFRKTPQISPIRALYWFLKMALRSGISHLYHSFIKVLWWNHTSISTTDG